MPKIVIFLFLFFAAVIGLICFLLIKKFDYTCENLTSVYKVKLKRKNMNSFESAKDNFFYKIANILVTWLFFIAYFLNNTVMAKDDKYVNKYNDDNYFKYNVTLYSPKNTGLPSDCPPKLDINQAYSKNKLLAVTDCIPGNPGNSPTPCVNVNPPPSTPCIMPTPTPCVDHKITPPPQKDCVNQPCAPCPQCPGPGGTHLISPSQCVGSGGGGGWNKWAEVSWGRWMPWSDFGQYQHWSDGGPYDSQPGYRHTYVGQGTPCSPCAGGGAQPPWNQGIQGNPNPQMCGQGGTPIGGPGSGGGPSMCGLCGTAR